MPIGEKTNLNELIAMGRVVAVDTRKAILDKNYYISAVEKALKNGEKCIVSKNNNFYQG